MKVNKLTLDLLQSAVNDHLLTRNPIEKRAYYSKVIAYLEFLIDLGVNVKWNIVNENTPDEYFTIVINKDSIE